MKKIILLTCVLFCCFKHSYAQRLDPLFGGKGFVTTDFKKGNLLFEVGRQILTQKDGNFIAVIEIGGRTSIARFLSNGKIDTSFANKGYSQFMSISEAKAVQQSDGKIVVAGNNYNDYTNYDFTLFRYNTNGSPDIRFGEDGKVITDFGSADYVSSVGLQSNGNIVVTGIY